MESNKEMVQVEETVKAFFNAYLVERDLESIISYLDSTVQWVETGKIVLTREDAIQALQLELSCKSWSYAVNFITLQIRKVVAGCALLFCRMEIRAQGGNPKNRKFELQVTAGWRNTEKGWKLFSFHGSEVNPWQEKETYYPCKLWHKDKNEFERRIHHHSLDILAKSIPGGMIGVYWEPDLPYYYINDQMLAYLGYTYHEFITCIDNKTINCIHPDDRERVLESVQNICEENKTYEIQYRMIKKDGQAIWVYDIGKKEVAEDGRIVCMSVIRDVTVEVEAREKLLEQMAAQEYQSKWYNHLFESVLCGIAQFRWDNDKGMITYKNANREAMRILGYTPEEFWAVQDWRIDCLLVLEDLSEFLEETTQLKDVGDAIYIELRLIQKNGEQCWISNTTELVQDIDGEVLFQSVFLDINDSKRAELENRNLAKQVEAASELLELALANTSIYPFFYNPQSHMAMCLKRTCAHYHCSEKLENMPQSVGEQIVAGEYRQVYNQMYDQIHRGEKTATAELRLKGDLGWCRVTLSTFSYQEDRSPALVVGIIEDITKAKEMEVALEKARSQDPLTGLYCKDAGVRLVREYLETKNPNQVCTMMLLDMDDFKAVNAEEGKFFADVVLQEVADILQDEIKAEDIAIRLGGDEFMLFVKDCHRGQARYLGSRIAQRIQNIFDDIEQRILISASIGMCVTTVVDEYNGLYRCAESTLQYVKAHGKGVAACYLDISNELGMLLTQMYTEEYLFTTLDRQENYFAENLVDFALDLLGKAKNLDKAIYLLLAKVGKGCGLDRVSIIEVNAEYLCYHYNHQWAKDKVDYQMGRIFYYDETTFEILFDSYDGNWVSTHAINPKGGMAKCLHAAIWNHGTYAGALCFESKDKHFNWTPEQHKLIQELTKVLSSFIMKARADAISQAKTEFLSRISHEIRTPMHVISGMTMIAKSLLHDQEKLRDCLHKIEASNKYLLSLINDVLEMSKIESGKVELNYEHVKLEEVRKWLQEMMLPEIEKKGVSLIFTQTPWLMRLVILDELRLKQVLINLIGNAVKFTEPGGQIIVKAEPLQETDNMVQIRFAVKDTGISISPEAKERIFRAFEQGNKHIAFQYGGTGLGLSISQRLVQMMGGTLEVESEKGQGSEFYFTLPLLYGTKAEQKDQPPKNLETNPNLTGKRILLAEDQELNREIIATLLARNGCYVEAVENGKQAFEKFVLQGAGYYDVILMDIRMPVMDGLEATRRIRRTAQGDARTIPILAMTANAFGEDAKKSIESGMNEHLAKPLDLNLLVEKLGQYLG